LKKGGLRVFAVMGIVNALFGHFAAREEQEAVYNLFSKYIENHE